MCGWARNALTSHELFTAFQSETCQQFASLFKSGNLKSTIAYHSTLRASASSNNMSSANVKGGKKNVVIIGAGAAGMVGHDLRCQSPSPD